jgi:hypothetical protein
MIIDSESQAKATYVTNLIPMAYRQIATESVAAARAAEAARRQ